MKKNHRFWLGCLIVVMGAAYVGMLLFFKVPEGNERILDMAGGILIGWGGAVVSFYFGSSSGSADKDEAITGLTDIGSRLLK